MRGVERRPHLPPPHARQRRQIVPGHLTRLSTLRLQLRPQLLHLVPQPRQLLTQRLHQRLLNLVQDRLVAGVPRGLVLTRRRPDTDLRVRPVLDVAGHRHEQRPGHRADTDEELWLHTSPHRPLPRRAASCAARSREATAHTSSTRYASNRATTVIHEACAARPDVSVMTSDHTATA